MGRGQLHKWVLLGTAGIAVLLSQEDPFKGKSPHSIPSCDPKGSAQSARCSCLGMVHAVQEEMTGDCWADYGIPLPDEPELRSYILHSYETRGLPKELEKCMADIPDHCYIVAAAGTYKLREHTNECRTQCKPENCHCADQGCPSHQETDRY